MRTTKKSARALWAIGPILVAALVALPVRAQQPAQSPPAQTAAPQTPPTQTMPMQGAPGQPGMMGGQAGMQGQDMGRMPAGAAGPAGQAMMQSMQKMQQGMMGVPLSGNADRDFVAMMIPHHQGAIDMARVELQYGKDPTLRRMARGIITAQQKEIREMQQWEAKHPVSR